MMRMWFLEVRADFGIDKEKNDIMDQVLKNAAADVSATGTLLISGARIEVVLYSDDFMLGRKELEWLVAKKAVVVQEDTVVVTEDTEQTPVSDDMIEALNILRKRSTQ